jgi:Sec-independent protein translocase protein TatA
MNRETMLMVIGLIVIGLPGAINTIGNAIEKIAKAKKAVEAPNVAQDEKIADHEKRISRLERHQENDHKELAAIREYNRISALAQIALLDHGLDGNNVKPMQDAKNELNHWLAQK